MNTSGILAGAGAGFLLGGPLGALAGGIAGALLGAPPDAAPTNATTTPGAGASPPPPAKTPPTFHAGHPGTRPAGIVRFTPKTLTAADLKVLAAHGMLAAIEVHGVMSNSDYAALQQAAAMAGFVVGKVINPAVGKWVTQIYMGVAEGVAWVMGELGAGTQADLPFVEALRVKHLGPKGEEEVCMGLNCGPDENAPDPGPGSDAPHDASNDLGPKTHPSFHGLYVGDIAL